MRKAIVAMAVVVGMMLSVAGCGPSEPPAKPGKPPVTKPVNPPENPAKP